MGGLSLQFARSVHIRPVSIFSALPTIRYRTWQKSTDMNVSEQRIPHGPEQKFRVGEDLLDWMGRHFKVFGDTYSASIYGTSVYVTRDVDIAYRALVENWQNYVKGQNIARVGLLLGKGLMVSKGDLWKRQRRMI